MRKNPHSCYQVVSLSKMMMSIKNYHTIPKNAKGWRAGVGRF